MTLCMLPCFPWFYCENVCRPRLILVSLSMNHSCTKHNDNVLTVVSRGHNYILRSRAGKIFSDTDVGASLPLFGLLTALEHVPVWSSNLIMALGGRGMQ